MALWALYAMRNVIRIAAIEEATPNNVVDMPIVSKARPKKARSEI